MTMTVSRRHVLAALPAAGLACAAVPALAAPGHVGAALPDALPPATLEAARAYAAAHAAMVAASERVETSDPPGYVGPRLAAYFDATEACQMAQDRLLDTLRAGRRPSLPVQGGRRFVD